MYLGQEGDLFWPLESFFLVGQWDLIASTLHLISKVLNHF